MLKLNGFGGRILADAIIATVMVVYAILLIVIGAETGVSVYGYYLIFMIGVFEMTRRHNIECLLRNTPYQQFKFASWAAALAAAFYSMWVVFNTRILIGGPIPTLVQQRQQLETSAAAGNNVAEQLEALQSFIDSPERFAINVWVTLAVFGMLLAGIAALVSKVRLARTST